jgi:hypothetical protein
VTSCRRTQNCLKQTCCQVDEIKQDQIEISTGKLSWGLTEKWTSDLSAEGRRLKCICIYPEEETNPFNHHRQHFKKRNAAENPPTNESKMVAYLLVRI